METFAEMSVLRCDNREVIAWRITPPE